MDFLFEFRVSNEAEAKLESPPVLASSCRTNLYDIKMTSCTGRRNKLQSKHTHTHPHNHTHTRSGKWCQQAGRAGRHKLGERAQRRGSLTCPLYTKCVAFIGVCVRERRYVCLCLCVCVCVLACLLVIFNCQANTRLPEFDSSFAHICFYTHTHTQPYTHTHLYLSVFSGIFSFFIWFDFGKKSQCKNFSGDKLY